MKKNLTTIFLITSSFVLTNCLYAQYDIINNKTWVGENLEFLKIDSQKIYFEVFGSYPEEKEYIIKNDTLRLFDRYTTSTDNFSKVHIKNYDFRIMEKTPQTLQLMPINSNAFTLANNENILKYKEQSLIRDTNFHFKRIRFRSTTCYGTCPQITLQITNQKELKFIGGEYAIEEGFYTSKIPDSLYAQFLELLFVSDLKNLKTWPQIVYDAPEYTLEISYDGQVKCLKAFFLPSVCRELIDYLLIISRKVILEKCDQPFEITFQSTCGKYKNPMYK